MAASSSGFLTGIIIDIVVCIIAFLVFSVFRILNFSRKYYAPKLFMPDLANRPAPMPYAWSSIFSWVKPIILYKEPDIITSAGLDTAIYLRVLAFGVELFTYVTAWCLIAMLPVNLTSDFIDELMSSNSTDGKEYKFSEFDKCSLANVPTESNRMWVHLICVYAVSIITMWLLYRYSKESVLLRIMFIANSERVSSSHSVLVTDIPQIAKATAKAMPNIKEARKNSCKRLLEHSSEARHAGSSLVRVDNPVAERQGSNAVTSFPGTGARVGAGPALVVGPSAGMDSQPRGAAGHSLPAVLTSPSHGALMQGEAGRASSSTGVSEVNAVGAAAGVPNRGLLGSIGSMASQRGSSVPPSAVDLAVDGGAAAPAAAPAPDAAAGDLPDPGVPAVKEGGEGVRRRRHKYTYDLKDESLDPHVMAKKLLRSGVSPKGLVEKEFNDVYPNGAVVAVEMVCDQSVLEPLVQEYDKLKQQLEDLLNECEHRFAKGLEVKRKTKLICPLALGDWGKAKYGKGLLKSVDALQFFIDRLSELDRQIENEQPLSSQIVWPSAFITFRSRQDQACASTSLHHHDTSTWLTGPAPEPNELLWYNLGLPLKERSSRNTLMWVAFWLMCFFFMIPVAAVQALIESPRLADNPVLGPLVGNEVIGRLLESVIPGLALKIFLILVPWILTLMIKFSGAKSLSDVDMGVVSRFFIFQVITVFAGSVLTGSFFNQVEQWVKDPASVISVLGTAIPMVSTFFITYIAVDGLFVKPIGIIRVVGLIIYWLLAKLSGSPKARDRLWQEQKTTLGTTVVDHSIAILLGLVYSCINPIITPFCLVYFCVVLVIERYQNIYVTTREYESKGQLWAKVFTQVLTALYIMQLCMLGLLGIKKFLYTPVLIPLPLFTIGFHFACNRIFSKPWKLMSLHDAAELDKNDRAAAEEPQEAGEAATEVPEPQRELILQGPHAQDSRNAYLSPGFKVVPGAIELLLREAEHMITRIDSAQQPLADQGEDKGKDKGKDKDKASGEEKV